MHIDKKCHLYGSKTRLFAMKALYFAYGSNMDPDRITSHDRAPSARFVCSARLDDYYLAFGKPGADGSGKAGIRPKHDTAVWGVVFEIDESDWRTLDAAEGNGMEYQRSTLTVKSRTTDMEVDTYLPLKWDSKEQLMPHQWYLDHLTKGAEHFGLPPEYVVMLEMEDVL